MLSDNIVAISINVVDRYQFSMFVYFKQVFEEVKEYHGFKLRIVTYVR